MQSMPRALRFVHETRERRSRRPPEARRSRWPTRSRRTNSVPRHWKGRLVHCCTALGRMQVVVRGQSSSQQRARQGPRTSNRCCMRRACAGEMERWTARRETPRREPDAPEAGNLADGPRAQRRRAEDRSAPEAHPLRDPRRLAVAVDCQAHHVDAGPRPSRDAEAQQVRA
jgi:hypothetical protein